MEISLLRYFLNKEVCELFRPQNRIRPIRFFSSLFNRMENEALSLTTVAVVNSTTKKNKIFVLLADDDSDDRELFEEAITEINTSIQVLTVEDGLQLMKVLNEKNSPLPDILFLDLNMPGKSGKECLKEIKNDARLKEVPVIIYSTSAHNKDINETHAFGANLYIRKPNTFPGLINVIKKVFSLDLEKYKSNQSMQNFVVSTDTD